MNRMKTTWILVVNKTRAKFFESSRIDDIPVEIFEMDNPAGHLKEQELVSDRPGRAMSDPFIRRTALSPHHKKTEQVTTKFINEIATQLRKFKNEGRFDNLVLVAEPRLLGKIRESFSSHKDLQITNEVHHDLLKISASSLPSELHKHLYPENLH